MKELGLGLSWNDFLVGQQWKTIGRTVFEADIIHFIGVSGMQEVLFNNIEYIEHESPTGKRIAPAALVWSIAEGLVIQAALQKTGLAFLGMDLEVKAPVVTGDTIHVEFEVTDIRAASKGNRGLVRTRNHVINQRGDVVLSYRPLRLIKGHD